MPRRGLGRGRGAGDPDYLEIDRPFVETLVVRPGVGAASSAGWSAYDYGLPFTRKETAGAGRFLSTQVWSAGNQLLRSNYVRFEMDQKRTDTSSVDRTLNRRRTSTRTVYHDDAGRFADVSLSDFDGLGHYRQVQTGGNFPGSNVRTTVTSYHPTIGTYQLGANGVALAYSMLPATSPWVLGTFADRSVAEGTFREASQAHFNPSTGFLERQRVFFDTNGPGPDDLIAVFMPDGSGNLQQEQYFGGDGGALGTGALDTLPLPADQYCRKRCHALSKWAHFASAMAVSKATALLAAALTLGFAPAASQQTPLDPARGQIDGKVALAFLPQEPDGSTARDPARYEVHLADDGDLNIERVFPAATWFLNRC